MSISYGRKLSRNKKNFDFTALKKSPFFFNKLNFKELRTRLEVSSNLINLEVGFGTGDNVIFQSEERKKEIFLACDPFLSGNIKLLKKIVFRSTSNVYFTNLDFASLFDLIRNLIFNEIYILFPDPWPKKKHKKRRLVNSEFIKKLELITSDNSKVFVITDDKDYSDQINKCFLDRKFFKLFEQKQTNINLRKLKIFPTKYYNKALTEKKEINFCIYKK